MRRLPLHAYGALEKPDLARITERDFQIAVAGAALDAGWLVHYERQSGYVGRAGRWRGSGPRGRPDLVLARGGQVLLAELKSESGRVRREQAEWLAAAGAHARLWRPRDWKAILASLEKGEG